MLFNSLRSKLTFATSLTASIILGVVITYAVIASKKKAIEAAKIEFHEKDFEVTAEENKVRDYYLKQTILLEKKIREE